MTSEVFQLRVEVGHGSSPIVNLRCPHCRHQGAFHGIPNCTDVTWGHQVKRYAGVRKCPNPECESLVFVVCNKRGTLEKSYPPETIDFDSTNLPAKILASLEEAINCHAVGSYRATALMVRRVLEELCEDKNAQGDTLKDRLSKLGSVA